MPSLRRRVQTRRGRRTTAGRPGLVQRRKLYDGANGGQGGASAQLGPRGGGPPEPRGGCRSGAAGVRAGGERREAGQHHAPPRLRRHVLRGHAAQRDRDRPGARPGGRRAASATRSSRRSGRRAASPGATRISASRCCSRRSPARPWPTGRRRCAGASRRCSAALTLDDASAAYAAIRVAGAGGLDEPVEHDVRDAPTVALREAMALAAGARLGRRRVRDRLRDHVRHRTSGAAPRARRRARAAPGDRRGVPRGCSPRSPTR